MMGKVEKKVEKYARKRGWNVRARMEEGILYLEGKVPSYREYVEIGRFAGKQHVEGVVNNLEYEGKKRRERKGGKREIIDEADVVIIGGGVTGCAIARELAKYELSIILVEKAEDVACGTTKANNAMVHTGIGEKMGTLKQKLCVEGHKMYEKLAEELHFPYEKNGMWIILTRDSFRDMPLPSFLGNLIARFIIPRIILHRARKLGIPMYMVKRKELLKEEPNVTSRALIAIYSPTYGVTSPYLFTIALAENAMDNGVKIMLDTEVVDIVVENGMAKEVVTNKGTIKAKYVINAAGLYADEVAEMAGAREYTIHPKKGSTLLFDREYGEYIKHSMSLLKFPRLEHYKGGGAMLTFERNIQLGPTIMEVEDREDTSVTKEEMEQIFRHFSLLLPELPRKGVIAYFAGLRAATFTEDFIIRAAKKVKNFIHVAGIQSPGLAAAPAVAKMVVEILQEQGLEMVEKKDFNPRREKKVFMRELSIEERKKIVEKNPLYGRVICRCEYVTEGEIVDAIHGRLGARNMDAIKRRTRAGMGRCQGSFCLPHVAKILARETGMPVEEIMKDGNGSNMFIGKAKCLLEEENEN